MKRFPFKIWIFLFGITIGWMLFSTQQEDEEGDTIAQVLQTSGSTTLRRSGTYSWIPLKNNAKLYNFDSIASAQNSSVRLRLEDGTELVLPQDTQLRIQKSSLDSSWNVYLNQGSLAIGRVADKKKSNSSNELRVVTSQHQFNLSQLKGSLAIDAKGTVATKDLTSIRIETQQGSSTLAQVLAEQKRLEDPNEKNTGFSLGFFQPLNLKELSAEINLEELFKKKNLEKTSLSDTPSTRFQAPASKTFTQPTQQAEVPTALPTPPDPPVKPNPTASLKPKLPEPPSSPLPQAAVPPTLTPSPSEAPSPIPTPSLQSLSFPKWTQAQIKFWHLGPFKAGFIDPIRIRFAAEKGLAQNPKLLVRIAAAGQKDTIEIPLDSESVSISPSSLPGWNPANGIARLEYTLRFIAKSSDPTEQERLGPSLKLVLLIPPLDRPLTISLDSWSAASSSGEWKEDRGLQKAQVSLHIRSLRETAAILPYLQGAGGLEVKGGQAWPQEGYQLIKGKNLLATVTQASPDVLNTLADDLELDLIYQGTPKDIIGSTQDLAWDRVLNEEKEIFYQHKGQWIRLDKTFDAHLRINPDSHQTNGFTPIPQISSH